METVQPKEHEYRTIDLWRHAQNVKATSRRLRKQASGQRPRHNRIGGAWTRTQRRMCSKSWRH